MKGVETHSSSPRRLRMDRVDTMAYQVKHKVCVHSKAVQKHTKMAHTNAARTGSSQRLSVGRSSNYRSSSAVPLIP